MSFELKSKKIGVYSTSWQSSLDDRKVSEPYLNPGLAKKETVKKLNRHKNPTGTSSSKLSPHKLERKTLPRPSNTKLDQIFKFNHALRQNLNSARNEKPPKQNRRNSSSAKPDYEKKSDYSRIQSNSFIVNRFGFRKPSTGNSTESSNLKSTDLDKGKNQHPGIFHRNVGFVVKSSGREDNLKHGTGIACLSVLKKRRKSTKKPVKALETDNQENSISVLKRTYCRCRNRKTNSCKHLNKQKTERCLSTTKFTEEDAIAEEKPNSYLSNGFLSGDTAEGRMSQTSNPQLDNALNTISNETEIKSIASEESNQKAFDGDDVFIEEVSKPCADDNPTVAQLNGAKSSNIVGHNSPIICPDCNKEVIDDEDTTNSIETDDISFNLSTCSLKSGENYHQVASQLKRTTKNDSSGKSGTSFSVYEDASSFDALPWTKNRSFFLRMTENRRKQHRKEWERTKNDIVFSKYAPSVPRDKALQDLQVDLDKARNKIKLQEEQLFNLRKKIELLQAQISEHECHVAEAEMTKVMALSESKKFQEVIENLKQRLEEKEYGDDLENLLSLSGCAPSLSQQPKSLDRESLPIEAGDLTLSSSGKEPDLGYFSVPRDNPSLSPPYQLAMLSPTMSSLHLSCNSMTSLLESCGEMSSSFHTAQCQTDLMLFDAARSNAENPRILIHPELKYHQRFILKTSPKSSRKHFIIKFLSKAVLLFAVWESAHQSTLDFHVLLNRYILPNWRNYSRSRLKQDYTFRY